MTNLPRGEWSYHCEHVCPPITFLPDIFCCTVSLSHYVNVINVQLVFAGMCGITVSSVSREICDLMSGGVWWFICRCSRRGVYQVCSFVISRFDRMHLFFPTLLTFICPGSSCLHLSHLSLADGTKIIFSPNFCVTLLKTLYTLLNYTKLLKGEAYGIMQSNMQI